MRAFVGLLVAFAITATASHEPCPPQPASPEVTTPATGVSYVTLVGWSDGPHPGVYYVDNDLCQPDGCVFSVWVYEETNGVEGLQRSDEVCDCTCAWEPGDTVVF